MEFYVLVDVWRHRISLASTDHELRRIERALSDASYGELAMDLALQLAGDIAKRRRELQRLQREHSHG